MPQLQGGLQAPNVPQVSHGGGMFAHGGVGSKILAGLSAFATNASAGLGNPAALQNLQAQQQRRMYEMELGKVGLQQQAEFQRQLMLKQYELSNPAPTEFQRELMGMGVQPGTPEWNQHMSSYVGYRENPPYIFTDPTTGRVMSVPRQAQQPLTDEQIDSMSGGQTPQASGNFRP